MAHDWNAMPIGTKAYSSTGGYWEKIRERGFAWKWCTGASFPTPGGDVIRIELPEQASAACADESVSSPRMREPASCPFCGGRDFRIGHESEDEEGWPTYVYCGDCNARGPSQYVRDPGVFTCIWLACEVTGWNRRATLLARPSARGACKPQTPTSPRMES